ncbi:MAG: ABC transporter permease [Pseudomonadota bacterium]
MNGWKRLSSFVSTVQKPKYPGSAKPSGQEDSLQHQASFDAAQVASALVGLALLAVLWEAYVRLLDVSALILPTPSRVLSQIVANWDLLIRNSGPTLQATVAGFLVSLSLSFFLSVLLDLFAWLRRAVVPILVVSQTLPLTAIAPLVVLWFGFGLMPKVILVALVTFFPMLVALLQGYEATDRELTSLLRSFGATRSRIFWIARVPTALPYFFAGLRISITYAVVAAIFAEYSGARAGLGIVILNAKNSFRPDLMLAAVVCCSVLTLLLYAICALAQSLLVGDRSGRRLHV